MNYVFSSKPVAEFYGRSFYSISDKGGQIVAYSEKVFEVPDEVRFLGSDKCLIFEKAIIMGGEIRGGVIWGGEIRGGVIRGGEIRGCEIWGGEIRGGVIRGGEIWGGVIRGGVIRGGVIRGGEIRGGEIRGGEIWGGEIWGGEIWGGKYEISLLQIQGTRHYCYATPTDSGEIHLGIGCHINTIAYWLENYVSVGQSEDYSPDEIAEYFEYIKLYATRYQPELLTKKSKKTKQ